MQAERIYRPDTVSVANYDVASKSQADLWQWWAHSPAEKYDGVSFADSIPLRKALRERSATLSASKRRGHIVITASLP